MAAITSRYARAFAEVVIDLRLDPDKASAELNDMAALLKSSAPLHTVLSNPSVPHSQKLALLDAIVSRLGAAKPLRNFIAVLVDHRRIAQIGEIAERFREELNRRLGIAEAQVSSARDLSNEEKQLLEREMGRITGKKIRASYSRDGDLLGGAVVRIGSTIYDGSVRGQLRKIKENLANG
jgi:F-type H+-transporting ATPase subunit delta